MIEKCINYKISNPKPSIFNRVIECLLIVLLAFMPLAFGAVEAWSEEVVVILAGAVLICFFLKLIFEENGNIVWSWIYLPLAVFILLVIFQLVPLPSGLLSFISPNTAAIKKRLLEDLPNAEILLKTMTLSFYPNATKHDLRLVLALAAVFFVVINVYREPDQIKRLIGTIVLVGALIAILALAQDLFGNGKIYWLVSIGSGKANSGTFINHSHYGQFMNLSIGAALGLIIVKLHEVFARKRRTPAYVFECLSSSDAKLIWFLLAMIILGAATVFISLTRGGMVSMLISMVFITLFISSRQSIRGQGWIIPLIALGAFICVLYIGFDAVYDRLVTLGDMHQAQGGRWQILKDISLAWIKFPLFGTGLGTHEVVYPMFDRSTFATLAVYAENEYAQAAEETGLIGLVSLIIFGIFVCIYYLRNVKSSSEPICSASYGLGFGLLAILIHSLSDFGQHLPANAFLSAIFCALLITMARMGRENGQKEKKIKPFWDSRYIRVVILLCVFGVFIWAVVSANNARHAETHWKKALSIEKDLVENNWQGNNEKYKDLISNAAAASNYQSDNVKYKHWLNVYRWESISRNTDPNTGEIIISEQAMEIVRRIVDELHNARYLCPTFGATYCIVGQLEKFILNNTNGSELIRKGFQLAPCDPTVCFVAGLLDVEGQNIDEAFDKFKRAVELDVSFFQSVADVYIDNLNRPDLAVTLADDDINRLSYVASEIAGIEEYKTIVENAQVQIVELLRTKCSEQDVSALAYASLANIYRKENNKDEAINYYRDALALEYGQIQWRITLAKLLAETGRIQEAIHEARVCLRLSPRYETAERLIADLSVLPNSVKDESLVPLE